jgi:hypothetical protein
MSSIIIYDLHIAETLLERCKAAQARLDNLSYDHGNLTRERDQAFANLPWRCRFWRNAHEWHYVQEHSLFAGAYWAHTAATRKMRRLLETALALACGHATCADAKPLGIILDADQLRALDIIERELREPWEPKAPWRAEIGDVPWRVPDPV